MSDYLTRLAARALHGAQQIRPRLPSLFEPIATPLAAQPEFVEVEEEATATPRRRPRAVPHVSAENTQEPLEMPAKRTTAGSAPPNRGAEPQQALTAHRIPPPAEARKEPADKNAPPVLAAGTVPSTPAAPVSVRPVPAPPPSPSRIVESGRPERLSRVEAPFAPPSKGREREQPQAPRLSVSLLAPRPAPTAVPPATLPRGTERTPAQIPTPPAITVTIGRVEVRAITASEAPRQPMPKTRRPNLPLDEYLRQRNGGAR